VLLAVDAMSYWVAAQLDSGHVPYALHCLTQLGYEVYAPRLRTHYISHGRKVERRSLLFPSYAFVMIEAQWHVARRAHFAKLHHLPGVGWVAGVLDSTFGPGECTALVFSRPGLLYPTSAIPAVGFIIGARRSDCHVAR
jgi:hypothetical protein